MIKVVLVFIISFSFCSCGLDTFIYFEAPKRLHNDYDSPQDVNHFLAFETAELSNASASNYLKGFEVYYRIYEKKSDLLSDNYSINSYNESNPGESATYLLETKKYMPLSISTYSVNERPLIKKHSTNRKIKIRLVGYSGEDSGFYVNNVKIAIPIRSNSKKFTKDEINNKNEDVYSSTENTDAWYVNMYVATYGTDQNLKPIYSSLEFIGFLEIQK